MLGAGFANLVKASNSDQAVTILSTEKVDVLICDVELGGLDGWRLARLVRSGALMVNAGIPIIMVSAIYSERIAEVTAKQYQINRFIPFSNYQSLPAIVQGCLLDHEDGLPKSSLLVIEDYLDTIELIERVLGSRFEIETASDGEAGFEAWKARRHDLVLCDVMLPKMSGAQVLSEIMRINPKQSVVMMTAYGSPDRAGALMLRGAVDFISKPFRAEQLRRVCEIAVQREDFLISNEQFAQHQESLYREKERAQVTLQSLGEGVITTNAQGDVDYLNPVAERISGWSSAEAYSRPLRKVLSAFNRATGLEDENAVEMCLRENAVVRGARDTVFRNRDGHEIVLDNTASPIHNREGQVVGAVMVFRDVTESRLMEEALAYQATHDSLTGLANRHEFEQRLQHVLQHIRPDEDYHALCYIDLDQFKLINDTCGHVAGDQLLRHIADILSDCVRRSRDMLARFGGDEFVLLLEGCPLERAISIAESMCQAIQDYRFVFDGKSFSLGASIGVVAVESDVFSTHEVLSRADAACYLAKEKGRNRVHVYRVDDEEMMQRRGEMHVVTKINDALETGAFALHFQEIASLDGGDPAGKHHYELLIRMRDGNGGWLSPGFFLPAAERYNLAAKIDRWVITTAFNWFIKHPQQLAQLGICSINLSAISLNDKGFYSFIEQEFKRSVIPPSKICFEITETAAITNLHQATAFIRSVRDLGCSFALDDFGSGMSSYGYLKNLPVDYLKIDGVFVRDVMHDPIDRAMVRSINEIGQVLGLKTIAEYVENQEILDEMRSIGLDFVQGYAVGRPAPMDDLLERGCAE